MKPTPATEALARAVLRTPRDVVALQSLAAETDDARVRSVYRLLLAVDGLPTPRFCPLTTREKFMLSLLAQGMTYKQIARQSNLQVSTVRTHLRKIYIKLEVPDRAQAVLRAYHEGWI